MKPSAWVLIPMVVLMIFSASCTTASKPFKPITNQTKSRIGSPKYPLSVAIVTNEIENYKFTTSVSAKCFKIDGKRKKPDLRSRTFTINLEDASLQLISDGLKPLFNSIEFIEYVDVRNLSKYDLTLIPYIDNIVLEYDKDVAENRKINYKLNSATPFKIFTKVSMGFKVIDNNKITRENLVIYSDVKELSITEGSCFHLFEDDYTPLLPLTILGSLGTRGPKAKIITDASEIINKATSNASLKLLDSFATKLELLSNLVFGQLNQAAA